MPTELEPGRFLRLGPGETLANTNFDHPNTAFGPFTKDIKRTISTGLNVSYSSLFGDLESINFSAIKAGMLSERDFYRLLQAWMAPRFHRRIYKKWSPYAALGGYFSAAEARGTERILWAPRGWKPLEPMTDIQAAIMARRAGLGNFMRFCAEQGIDFEENLEAIVEENRLAKEYGVDLVLELSPTAKQPAPASNDDAPSGKPGASEDDGSGAVPLRSRRKAGASS
jgi:capsid protein